MYKLAFSFTVIWLRIMVGLVLAQDFTWENLGADHQHFGAVLVNPQNSEIIFAAQSGNILKSDNSGKSWRRVLGIRGFLRNINNMVMDENNPNIIYAATDNGLYRSRDAGERWERVFRGKNSRQNQCTAIGMSGQLILVGTSSGLFISQDGGRSWDAQKMGSASAGIFNIDFSQGENKTIYLAAENGVFKSLDHGQSWENIFDGFTVQKDEEQPITQEEDIPERQSSIRFIKADKNNINLLYLSSAKGVYRSLNQGKSWDKLSEYGLLNPDVKMLCLSDKLGILAVTSSGVFAFRNERWQEISFGLAAGKLNFIALDYLDNIYIAAEKGIYRLSQSKGFDFSGISLIEEYLKSEPEIRKVQEAAIKYAEVSPLKISQWRKEASRKAWLPQIRIGLDRNSTDLWHWEGGSTTKSDDDILRRGKDTLDWDVSLSWDLGDLIWNEAQTGIDVRSKLMVELRDDILDQVNKLYFERIRLKSELDSLAIEDRYKRFQKQSKLEELAASLDALTCGYYSEQLRLLRAKQQR
ncbi:MAG: hypothetical protein COV73_01715 [Candidatus Omnitrophica bacterium CG11_big_fil_rev_8_21_14_0_20_43_6]|nr:MAG: hypothetical protein COV73_01715 [Candidatus Omnitrophica bacterium CG11_big_fil_rev_8_21_14_0_20_43_6]